MQLLKQTLILCLLKLVRTTKPFKQQCNIMKRKSSCSRQGTLLLILLLNMIFWKEESSNAGNQNDLTITQQFDFPSAYIKKSQLAKTQTANTISTNRIAGQDILLQAKNYCFELIFQTNCRSKLRSKNKTAKKYWLIFKNQTRQRWWQHTWC